jgi:hypothetical protein
MNDSASTPLQSPLPAANLVAAEPDSLRVLDWVGWISVNDRLPEQATPVLAVITSRKQKPRVSLATHWRLGKGYSGTDPEWMEGSNAFIGAQVTHWMPLHLPPVPVEAARAQSAPL